jgi:hypothetical protein
METMALGTPTDTNNSTAKGTLNKITDSKTTDKKAIHNSLTDTEGQTKAMRMDTKKPTARKIDNMIHEASNGREVEDLHNSPMDTDIPTKVTLGRTTRIRARKIDSTILDTSNDQAEAAIHLRTDQDHRDHRSRPTRTTEGNLPSLAVSLLNPEDMTHRMVTHSNGQATKLKLQNELSKIQEMAMGSGGACKMVEIGQRVDHLRRSQMEDLVRQCHRQSNQRRVQWRNGRLKKRQDCTRMPTNQK